MKILVVDDNELLGSLLQVMLENEGNEVRSAQDGIDGYLTYILFQPDIVITDIQMPRENGLELMKHIRTHNPTARAIYMSGNLEEYWLPLEEEKKRYPISFIEKPFSKDELMTLVSELSP